MHSQLMLRPTRRQQLNTHLTEEKLIPKALRQQPQANYISSR